jgi:hypothetical protein
MRHSPNDRQSPLAPFLGHRGESQSWARSAPACRGVEALRTRYRRFLAIPTGKGFVQVSLDESWALSILVVSVKEKQ